jgi:hypothetical protein
MQLQAKLVTRLGEFVHQFLELFHGKSPLDPVDLWTPATIQAPEIGVLFVLFDQHNLTRLPGLVKPDLHRAVDPSQDVPALAKNGL